MNEMRYTLRNRLLTTTAAYDSGKAGWKLDADGKIEMKDGNPIYVNSSGQEQTVSGTKISELNAESKQHRVAKEELEVKLAAYKDIDPVIAKKAIEDIAKIDSKKLIDAGEVDKVKNEIKSQYDATVSEKDKIIAQLTTERNNDKIQSVFANSEFVRDSIAVPRDMFEATFKSNFKINEKGDVEAYDKAGNRVYSKERMGEFATPDEALKLLVELHPQKDTIIKANAGSGSGSQGAGGGQGKGNVIKRADFEKLTPAEQSSTAAKTRTGEMTIVD